MNFHALLMQASGNRRRRTAGQRNLRGCLCVEALEPRTMLTVGFADVVLDFYDSGAGPKVGPYGGTLSSYPVAVETSVVLGSDTDDFLSLPTGSYVTVGFQDETIVDGPGDDIYVNEIGTSDERGNVYVSSDGEDFTLLGTVINDGDTNRLKLDLAAIGFTEPVIAVKIEGLDAFGGSPGFDLANVQALHYNQPPTANDDSGLANEDGPPVDLQLTNNDTDPDGSDDLEILSVDTTATQGSVTINPDNDSIRYHANGQFEYLAAGETAVDTFSYTVTDNNGGVDTATVSVTILGQNDAPVANDDAYATNEDGVLDVAAPGVLQNDTDADGGSLTASLESGPSHGELNLNSDGSFVYTPDPDFHGTDSFTYMAGDGDAASNLATVRITVRSAQEQIEAILSEVLLWVDDGLINRGQGNALTSKLGGALDKLADGEVVPLVNKLEAFENQLRALVRSGQVPASQAQALIAQTETAIHSVLAEATEATDAALAGLENDPASNLLDHGLLNDLVSAAGWRPGSGRR